MARIRCPWCPSRCPAPAVSQSGELSAAWNSKHRESLREFLRESQMLQKAYEAYMFCLFGIVLSCFVMRHAALHRSEALGVHLCSLPLPYRAQLQLAKSTPQKKACSMNKQHEAQRVSSMIVETCEVQSSVVFLSLYQAL